MEAASRRLVCLSSAVNDLQLLENLCPKSPDWEYMLLVLTDNKVVLEIAYRPFLLCARKWLDKDDDTTSASCTQLGEQVTAMEDAISNMGQVIHSLYLTCMEDGFDLESFAESYSAIISDADTESVTEKIRPWISVFCDLASTKAREYSLIKKADLVEFMDSVLEYLGHATTYRPIVTIGYQIRDELHGFLRDKVMFFRNFICFVTLHNLENIQLGHLFSHAEFVTSNAVSNSMADIWNCHAGTVMGRISDMEQKIIRVEPQVHETCVQALIASKLSTESYQELDEDLLRAFVDSLLFYLLAILKNEVYLMISLKDQLQRLWEGLISLRTILKVGSPKLDEKLRDLTRLSLCDAGLVLFSLSFSAIKHGSVKDMDLMSFGDFVERLELIKATMSVKCPETSSSNFPKTNVLGFLDSLLKHMIDLATSQDQASSVAFVDDTLQTIREELEFLCSNFLVKIVAMRHEDEELQALWDCVAQVAYKTEFLIDSLLVEGITDSCPMLFDSILKEIMIIKADALKILHTKVLDDLKAKEAIKRSRTHTPSQGSKLTKRINNMVVGLDDAATSILNRLRRGSSKLQIVPIVGMPGLGKTTLANKIYNDPQVKSHFYKRAWVTVSQQYHKKRLMLEILTCTRPDLPKDISNELEEDLALRVKQSLQRATYLIVLDDVWYTEVWNDLKALFPDDKNGSRVLLTSRYHDIVASEGELNEGPHYLRPLSHDESWDLLNMMLYPGKKDLPSPELLKHRRQIMEMCQGVPLIIVILAGILANKDRICWESILESLNSSRVTCTEQFTATLELSYQNLPDNLKPCFLYFGTFSEDHEHTIKELIRLWIAEGLVQESQLKSMEDVANDYVMDLICRSLVIVSKQRYMDGIEACRVHDLLHEFCVRKGTEENFLQLVHENDEQYALRVPFYLRRLCIKYNPQNFYKFRLFAPTVRSISFFSDEGYDDLAVIFHMFRLVKVLNLSQVSLDPAFPNELELLVQLRYLAVQGYTRSVPTFVGNLLYLETLIIVLTKPATVSLPDTIWNLKKLRHLQLKCQSRFSWFEFPMDSLDNAAKLDALHTFSGGIILPDKLDKIFRKFPNIHELDCFIMDINDSPLNSVDTIPVLDFLVGLDSLTLEYLFHRQSFDQFEFEFAFQFPLTLRELTLSGFHFRWSEVSTIQKLPNLEVLNLMFEAFCGSEWNIEEEGFDKVNYFKLSGLFLEKWTASECMDCFPSLRKLVLEDCYYLQEIPSCLGSSTLEVIEVRRCPYSASFMGPIQEEQMDLGNTELKIIVESSSPQDDCEPCRDDSDEDCEPCEDDLGDDCESCEDD